MRQKQPIFDASTVSEKKMRLSQDNTSSDTTKKKAISVSARKAKGRKLQQDVCKMISELTGFSFGPDLPISSRGMGQSGTDVRLESAVLKEFPFSVECKRQENMAIYSWINQARANQISGTEWLLVLRQNQDVPVVVLDAVHFFKILKNAKEK